MHAWAVFIIVVLLLGLLAGGAFYAYTKLYKQRHTGGAGGAGSFPTPAPSGIGDWIKEKWHAVRNPKTQSGAGYESTGAAGARGGYGRPRGAHGGALDPDEAWDSRVGNEADGYGPGGYYEEQELGLHQPTAYSGGAGGGGGFEQTSTLSAPGAAGDRGRSKSPAGGNPFGDDNAASLRSVSPRPDIGLDTGRAVQQGQKKGTGSGGNSPTFERRSMFRENM